MHFSISEAMKFFSLAVGLLGMHRLFAGWFLHPLMERVMTSYVLGMYCSFPRSTRAITYVISSHSCKERSQDYHTFVHRNI